MKKLIYLILCFITVCSFSGCVVNVSPEKIVDCYSTDTVRIVTDKYGNGEPMCSYTIIKYYYKDGKHDMIFNYFDGNSQLSGTIHNPDCEYCLNRAEMKNVSDASTVSDNGNKDEFGFDW